MIEANRRITTREIVTRLNSSNSIVRDPVKRLDVPLSRKETKLLSEQSNKINVCSSKYQIFVSLERNCCTIQRFNHPYMIYLNSQFYSLEISNFNKIRPRMVKFKKNRSTRLMRPSSLPALIFRKWRRPRRILAGGFVRSRWTTTPLSLCDRLFRGPSILSSCQRSCLVFVHLAREKERIQGGEAFV